MNKIKLERISSNIQREVSNILANEAKDSLLKSITITGCETNSDVSVSKVFFTSILEIPKEELERELNEAASYVRCELADRIELRHTPRIEFKFDTSIAYAEKIENIIKEIHEEE